VRSTSAIFRRELGAYFNTPLGYIVVACFLLTFGSFFFYVFDVLGGQVASMRSMFRISPLLLAVLTPLVTMPLLAEERRSGTIELLLTLPITEWQVILGKYLAAVVVLATAILLTFSYPLTLALLGDLDPGPVAGGYFGLLLLGAAYAALGLLCSSVASTQVVAALSALLVCIFAWIADKLAASLPGGIAGDLLRFVGFDHHFINLQRGVVDTRDLVYFASVIVVSLCLAVVVLRRQRLAN